MLRLPMESISQRRFALAIRKSSLSRGWIRARRVASSSAVNAEALGLDVESGRPQRFRTMAGSFVAYEHEVTLHTLGIEFSAVVFFAHDPAFNRSLVGRFGWLDRLRIAIIDYDRM